MSMMIKKKRYSLICAMGTVDPRSSSKLGTERKKSTVAQTSMAGSRTSRRWDAGVRESWEDARVPRRRPRRGRTEKRCMSPGAGGTEVLAHTKVYEGKGTCGAKMERKGKVGGILYFFPSHNSGRTSQDPVSQARTRSGV